MNIESMSNDIYTWNRAFVASAISVVGGLYGAIAELPLVSILSMLAAIVPPIVKLIHAYFTNDDKKSLEEKDNLLATKDKQIASLKNETVESLNEIKGQMSDLSKKIDEKTQVAQKALQKAEDVRFDLEVFLRTFSMQEE